MMNVEDKRGYAQIVGLLTRIDERTIKALGR